jgi:hypothetical protein
MWHGAPLPRDKRFVIDELLAPLNGPGDLAGCTWRDGG